MKIQFPNIAIVGTGAMGRGIAQIAAQAGSQVFLLDAHPGAAEAAVGALQEQWSKLAGKGRITAQQAAEYAQRLTPVQALSDTGDGRRSVRILRRCYFETCAGVLAAVLARQPRPAAAPPLAY